MLTDPPGDPGKEMLGGWAGSQGTHPRKTQLLSKLIFILVPTYIIVQWGRDRDLLLYLFGKYNIDPGLKNYESCKGKWSLVFPFSHFHSQSNPASNC